MGKFRGYSSRSFSLNNSEVFKLQIKSIACVIACVEFLCECEVRSWYSECSDERDALPTFEPWPGQSYVDVEQSCVTELDSCHACHGMREVESGEDPANVAEASVLVISSLMNIINLPFNEQNMKICFFVGPVSPASCVAQSQSEPEPSEYLLHIYNN